MKKNNVEVWREINTISRMIHSIDPYHPTTTTIAAYPTTTYQPLQARLCAPDLDFISLNVYEITPILAHELQSYVWGIEGPFLVTEWSGEPFWTAPATRWGTFIEKTSTANADIVAKNYTTIFGEHPGQCLGGYIFYWGQRQERTHTVFSLIHEGGYTTQALEILQYFWAGTSPRNWCPRIQSFYVKGVNTADVFLDDSTRYEATLDAFDPDNDSLFARWEIREEGIYAGKVGGEKEAEPLVVSQSNGLQPCTSTLSFVTPSTEGPFRLYVFVYDNRQHVATANIPFYVIP
jgi:hypothetical protein